MRYTIEKENEVKNLFAEGKSIDYINSVTGIPKKVIWQWCPELRPHEDIVKQSVKQRYHFLFPDYEAKISSAFSPYICTDISEEEWEEVNKTVYDVLYEEAVAVFKNAISDPPNFGERTVLSNEKFLDYLKNFWDYDNSEYIKEKNKEKQVISKSYSVMCKNTLHYWSFLKNKMMRDVTKGDIQILHEKLVDKKLSPSRIYFILKLGLIPLEYAYEQGQTLLRTFDYKVPKKTRQKNVLQPLVISKIFNSEWKSTESYLANLLAYVGELKLQEVRALRLSDVFTEGFIITNNIYTRNGLEPNKNKRVVKINKSVLDCILKYTSTNPYNDFKPTDYVFFTIDRDRPAYGQNWTPDLKQVAANFVEDVDLVNFSIWCKPSM